MNYMTSATEIGQRMRSCRKSIGLTQARDCRKDGSLHQLCFRFGKRKEEYVNTDDGKSLQSFDKSADYFLYGTEDKDAGIDMEK